MHGVMYQDGPDFDYGPKLDWVVAGGESGPDARPMHPDWARALRDQCAMADVPFLFKQWGNHRPCSDANGPYMLCCSKSEAGRLLDGVEHNGFPHHQSMEPIQGDSPSRDVPRALRSEGEADSARRR